MATHFNQTSNTSNTANTAGQTQPRQQAPLGSPVFGLNTRMAGMGSGGDFFEKLFTKTASYVKTVNDDPKNEDRFMALKLLKNVAGLNYSGIIIAESRGDVVAAHVLVIEKTGNYPDSVVENLNGMRYDIMRTPAEALDPKYIAQVQNAVAAALKVPANTVVVADGTLVPNEFDIDNDSQVAELIDNCMSATQLEVYTRAMDYRGADLGQLVKQYGNGKFVIDLHFNSDETTYFDQTGMPVRQDVCVALSFKSNNTGNNNRSINQTDGNLELIRTYGYIDFEFTGPSMQGNMMGTQKFLPNFIITHVAAVSLVPSPDILVLAVASVMALTEDLNWMRAFRPTAARKNEIDYNDIGALNIEGNIEQNPTGYGKKYDTKSKTATLTELNKLIQTLVRPTMLVSIDIPKAGPETWYTSVFQHILTHRNPAAIKRVTDFMSFATSGVYQYSGEPMFVEATNKIHGGFYKAKDGFRDIRNLSCYLAVANHVAETGQQPAIISEYTNTLYSVNMPELFRASSRFGIISEMSNRTMNVKQMYDRMTFTGGFIANWVSALRAVEFKPMYSNAGGGNDLFIKRNTANFQSAMIGQDVRLMSVANTMPGSWTQYGDYNRQF